ncbi:MAG: class D beta-lactamase [Bacteroidetes bacterium]|nr:class D beta-lactamase [Bacteroidota bacterium]
MKIILALIISLSFFSCSEKKETTGSTNKDTITKNTSVNLSDTVNIKRLFDDAKLTGCFIVYDMQKEKYYYHDSARCNKEFIPASTFKIPNSLFSLEAGAVKDENEKLKWDGKDRNREEWNQDTDMKMAFKYSTVWFYQECARRIGEKRMQHFLDTLNYGNKNMSGGLDRFWLDGAIRITAMQQIALLKRIYDNKVPFAQRNIDILKNIMIMEKTDNYTLRAKTGTAMNDKGEGVAWYVGYVERSGGVYFFALNIDIKDDAKFAERIALTKRILTQMGLGPFIMK